MLLSGLGEILSCGAEPGDVLVRARAHSLLSVAGDPPLEALAEAAAESAARVVLCQPRAAHETARWLPGWRSVAARIHSLSGEEPRAPAALPAAMQIGILPPTDATRLAHLPQALRTEIEDALGGGHVTAAFVENQPVSFCYPVYETRALWDISIDTLEPFRRRGLAAACAEFLIDHMRRHGKEPVWGALEDNPASLELARQLGFTPVDEMTVFLRP
jgi:GNAT superfamily N-acetyltransferase